MCGLPDISNVKQCVRKIASRLQKANLVGAITIRNQSDVSYENKYSEIEFIGEENLDFCFFFSLLMIITETDRQNYLL
jgi:hypothetical protein